MATSPELGSDWSNLVGDAQLEATIREKSYSSRDEFEQALIRFWDAHKTGLAAWKLVGTYGERFRKALKGKVRVEARYTECSLTFQGLQDEPGYICYRYADRLVLKLGDWTEVELASCYLYSTSDSIADFDRILLGVELAR